MKRSAPVLAAVLAAALAGLALADPNPNSTTYDNSWFPAARDTVVSFTSSSDDTFWCGAPMTQFWAGYATDSVLVQPLADSLKFSAGSGFPSGFSSSPLKGSRRVIYGLRGFGTTTPLYRTWSWECEFCIVGYRIKGGGVGSGTISIAYKKDKGQR